MKYHPLFKEYLNCEDAKSVFTYLQKNLANSITGWDYFVNWPKVTRNIKEIEIDLNTLNFLIGKEDIEGEFKHLLRRSPSIIQTIPILLACRENKFTILNSYEHGHLIHKPYSFEKRSSVSESEINDACEFLNNSGIFNLFKNKTIKSIPDYVFGIEVGLDSNGRKNRGGTTMECIVGNILQDIASSNKYQIMSQATSEKIKKEWGINLHVDKSSRRFDFALNASGRLYLCETNFYGGGGSKLKATAGEYKSLFDFISNQKHNFIWITDGLGWKTTLRPLEECFNHVNFILNLKMAIAVKSTGPVTLLEQIITQGL